VIRAILARDQPVTHDGEFYPLPSPGRTSLGKALKSTVHPLRSDIPIFLVARKGSRLPDAVIQVDASQGGDRATLAERAR